MNVVTFSEARAGFKRVMDDTCRDHEPTVITRQNGQHVVMVSLDDFNSMQETMYLLSSPKNAQRLMQSIARVKAGEFAYQDVATDEQAESKE